MNGFSIKNNPLCGSTIHGKPQMKKHPASIGCLEASLAKTLRFSAMRVLRNGGFGLKRFQEIHPHNGFQLYHVDSWKTIGHGPCWVP